MPGYGTEQLHYFYVTGLYPAVASPDSDEEITVERMSRNTVNALIRTGEFQDTMSLAGLQLLDLHLSVSFPLGTR